MLRDGAQFHLSVDISFISTARWRALLAGLVSEVGMSLASMASKGESSFNFA